MVAHEKRNGLAAEVLSIAFCIAAVLRAWAWVMTSDTASHKKTLFETHFNFEPPGTLGYTLGRDPGFQRASSATAWVLAAVM